MWANGEVAIILLNIEVCVVGNPPYRNSFNPEGIERLIQVKTLT
jgi:hypothetical protein